MIYPPLSQETLIAFDKELDAYRREVEIKWKDSTEKINAVDIHRYLLEVSFKDNLGNVVNGVISKKIDPISGIEYLATKIGTKAIGYSENEYGKIKSLGDQPAFKIMDKIRQWSNWKLSKDCRTIHELSYYEGLLAQLN